VIKHVFVGTYFRNLMALGLIRVDKSDVTYSLFVFHNISLYLPMTNYPLF